MGDFGIAIANNLTFFADTAGAIKVVQDYVTPTMKIFAGIASLACAFFKLMLVMYISPAAVNQSGWNMLKKFLRKLLSG